MKKMSKNKSILRSLPEKMIYYPNSSSFGNKVLGFNKIKHNPLFLADPETIEQVIDIVKFANEHKFPVHLQSTGHGTYSSVNSGVFINTENLNKVSINTQKQTATFGAGVRWKQIIEKSKIHQLFPIAGSSSNVGTVGYLLGGGFGPLTRSHGISSDYLDSIKIVTANGDLVTANREQNSSLFKALCGGGNLGFGVIVEMEVHLAQLKKIYGGNVFFEKEHIKQVLEKWLAWQKIASPKITTSAIIINFPPLEIFPEHLRGRRLLSIRYAYPASNIEAKKFANEILNFAPVYSGQFSELNAEDIDKIHNDPAQGSPTWIGGQLLKNIDEKFIEKLVNKLDSLPFSAIEIRHLEQTMTPKELTSTVSGRDACYNFGVLGKNPTFFEHVLPKAETEFLAEIQEWLYPYKNINFMGKISSENDLKMAWKPESCEELLKIRDQYDPNKIFIHPVLRSEHFFTGYNRTVRTLGLFQAPSEQSTTEEHSCNPTEAKRPKLASGNDN